MFLWKCPFLNITARWASPCAALQGFSYKTEVSSWTICHGERKMGVEKQFPFCIHLIYLLDNQNTSRRYQWILLISSSLFWKRFFIFFQLLLGCRIFTHQGQFLIVILIVVAVVTATKTCCSKWTIFKLCFILSG